MLRTRGEHGRLSWLRQVELAHERPGLPLQTPGVVLRGFFAPPARIDFPVEGRGGVK